MKPEVSFHEPSLLWEFREVLARQAFGVTAYHLTENTPTSVTAEVALFDGQTCTIDLSYQGFKVRHR
jgi:hypothetical protein